MITDSLPALALGLEKAEPDLMQRQPRSTSEGIFDGGVGIEIALQGALVSLLTLSAYFIGGYMECRRLFPGRKRGRDDYGFSYYGDGRDFSFM